jgi:hypothetical protein
LFDDNQLTGPLPREWGAMTSLQHLGLNSNQLTGPLPREWGAMTKLQQLWLNSNQLTGPLPREWGALTNVANELVLCSNPGLAGSVPVSWQPKSMTIDALQFCVPAGDTRAFMDCASQSWVVLSTCNEKPTSCGTRYTTVPGDTLRSVAAKCGLDLQAVVDENKKKNPEAFDEFLIDRQPAGFMLWLPSGGSISACMPNPPASLKATFWYSCTRSGDFVCPTVACPAGSQASIAGQVPAPRVLAGSSQVSAAGCTYGCLTASACEKLWAQCKSSTDNVCIFADKPSLKQRWYMMTFIKKGSSEPLANVHCDPPRRYKFGHQG